MGENLDDLGVPVKSSSTETDDLGVPKKKISGTTSTNSEVPQSQSNASVEPSGYAPRSISKIKQDNLSAFDDYKLNSTVEGLKTVLANNKSVRFKNLLVEDLAKHGYSKDALWAAADEVNPPDETEVSMRNVTEVAKQVPETPEEKATMENQKPGAPILKPHEKKNIFDNVTDVIDKHIVGSAEALGAGSEQVVKGVKGINEAKTLSEAGVALTDIAAGAGKAIFSTLNLVQPEMAAFGLTTTALHELPESVKSEAAKIIMPASNVLPAEKQAEVFDKTLDAPFSLITTIADASGYKPEEGSWQANLMEIGNLLVPLFAHKAGIGVSERVKDINDLKDITQKAKEGKASEQELRDLGDIARGAQSLTSEEIKNASQDAAANTPVTAESLHGELASMEDALDKLPEGEAKQVLEQQIDFKKQEIDEVTSTELKSQMDSSIKSAGDKVTVEDLDSRIKQAEKDKANVPASNKDFHKIVDEHINKLKTERDAIKNHGNEIASKGEAKIGNEKNQEEMLPGNGGQGLLQTQVAGEKVKVENAPKGNHLNIGLLDGRTEVKMSQEEILSKLPPDVEVVSSTEVQGTEPTLSIETSRPLTDAEMAKLLEDTKQQAIPQMTDGVGVLHDAKRGTSEGWGEFNPEFFVDQKGKNLKEVKKGLSLEEADDLELLKLKAEHGKASVKEQAKIAELEKRSEQQAVVEKTKSKIEDVKAALKTIDPEIKIETYGSAEEMAAVLKKDGATDEETQRSSGSGGVYDPNTKTIHLNLDKVKANTLFHEGVHPILNAINATAPKLIDNLFEQVKIVEEKTGNKGKYSEEFASKYEESQKKMEAITEFIADVADGKIEITETNFDKIKQTFIDMLKSVGIDISDKITTVADLKSLAEKIKSGFEKGEAIDITKESGFVDSKGRNISDHDLQFSINNDYSDIKSKVTFTYLKNSEKFKKLKDNGTITEDKTLSDFDGEHIFLHSPDGAFSGDILKNGEPLVEGRGGVLYPIKFNEDGYFWASTKGGANSMVKQLNESAKLNKDGKAYMALTSAPPDKLLSSTTAVNGVLDIFTSKVLDENIKLGETDVKSAIIKAAKSRVEVNGKSAGLGLKGIDPKSSLTDVKNAVKEMLSPDKSTFADRKHFAEQVIGNIVDNVKGKKSEQKLAEFLHLGLDNVEMKGKTKAGYNLSKANVVSAISHMLQEPMLRSDKKAGSVYAILELDAKSIDGSVVEAIESAKHESYPIAIKSIDGSKTKLHILQDRNQWSENFKDPTTGEIVKKERELNIFPTSGVSTSPLELSMRKEGRMPMQEQKGDLVEKAGKRKEMTEDDKGNYLFYHYSDAKFNKLDPGKVGKHLATSRGESPRIKTSQLYTRPDRLEPNVPSSNGYVVRVPKDKVYDFNSDPLKLLPEAEKLFRKENGKDVAFDTNNQVAYVSKVAAEKGFKVTVSDWNIKGTKAQRAQTTESLPVEKYSNIKPGTTNQVEINPEFENIKPNAKRKDIQRQDVGKESLSDLFGRAKSFDDIKSSDLYKNKTETGKKALESYYKEFSSEEKVIGKTMKLAERVLDSEHVSDEIKAGLKEKGTDYIPLKLDVTQADAKAYVESFDSIGEIDKAVSNITNMSNKMDGINRAAIGKELFENLADKAKGAETIEEQKKWQDKAVEIATFTADNFRKAGQEINAAKAWKRMLERTPEGVIASVKDKIREKNESVLEKHSDDIKSSKEIIDEFIKSSDFENLVGEKVKAEIEKLAKKNPKKENIFNSKAVRDSRLEVLREKAKAAKGSASSSIIGLNSAQIEIYSEMGVIYMIEGAYKFKQWANKMKKENPDFTEEQLNGLWDKAKISKEYDPQGRTLGEFAKHGVFELMPPEVKKSFLDKMENKLARLSPESRKKLLGNALDEIQKLGGLSNERFKEMYAKELGLPGVDTIAEAKIRSLVDTINKSEKSAKELQDLYDSGASKEEVNAKKKEWINDVFNGQKANAELSDYFKNEKKIGNTLSTILQGNLLGPLSLVKNVYSNSLIQPLRFASRGVASSMDYVMSKAAGLPILNKLISEGRTMDALAYWKGETKGAMPGLKVAFKELIKGLNPEEMIERDLSQQLQPLKSMVAMYDGMTGKQKTSAYQHINHFAEATFGVPAEVMFRLLNLGDKPFRKAAEFGAAYEIGKLKGLKGNELEKFVLFPDSKSAELIKQRSEKSVYQQSEGLAKVAQQGIKGMETYLSEIPYIGDIAKVLFKSQIPYVKTPLNILGETMEYTFPGYTAAKASYYALKGDRRQAVDYFGKAVTGAAIRYGVNKLIQNNLVTGSSDRKDVEGTAIQYQNVPPNSLNITGLQRMMSGGNPAIKDNDVWVDYKNMGVVGLLIGVHANQKELKPSEQGYLGELFGMVSYAGQAAIEQSFLQGANTFLEAVTGDDKSKRKWAINTLGALGSIVYPNTLANISKAEDNTSRVTKADSFYDELVNTFKTKMFSGGSLPTKVNLWGESIKGAPEGSGKYIWYLLNVTKGRNVDTESFNYKIYDLWKTAEDPKDKSAVLPSIPRDYLVIRKVNIKLTPEQYEMYQKYTGRNRASLVEKYTKSENWTKDDLEKKIEKLKKIYASGAANAKKQMLFENPELKKKQ